VLREVPHKVIYIAGSAHSGSTLLDLILGSHSRAESVGELKHLPTVMAGPTNRRCACGLTISECSFWAEVIFQLRAKLPRALGPGNDGLVVDNELLVTEVLRLASRKIFVESTKTLSRFRTLSNTKSLDVYGVHIVRDGRAVAFSAQRKAIKRGLDPKAGNLMEAIKSWSDCNYRLAKEVSKHPQRWVRVHYEDLVQEPAKQVARVMELAGEHFESDQLKFHLRKHHNLGGNRLRWAPTGRIVSDTEFLESIDDRTWDRLTLAAEKTLKALGYPTTKSAALAMMRPLGESRS
jgi:Sulfotransferase family